MVLVTMLADGLTLTPLALALLGALVWLRRWRLAGMAGLAFVGAAIFVPLAKSLLHRARPLPNYSGAEAFGFPSGHATLSIAIVGTIVVILAHNLPTRWKSAVYAVTGAALALVALSRLYLLAHWPSDVLAGLLFGGSVVVLLAFLLQGRNLRLPAGRIAIGLAVIYWATYAVHVDRDYHGALAAYSRPLPVIAISRDDWLNGQWKQIPAARVLFDGEFAEPLILQTDLQIAGLRSALLQAGWQEHSPTWLASVLAHILPASGNIADLPPLRTYNAGRPALATFTLNDGTSPETRLVLNVWQMHFNLQGTSESRPLLTASMTREAVEPLLFEVVPDFETGA